MKVCLVTAFPPSRGDLNEYGYHLARTIQNDGRADLHILADRVDAAETVPGLSIERVWRFDSLWNPIYLLRAVRRIQPDVVWFNMGFATFAGRPVPAFFATAIPLLLRAFGFYTHVTLHSLFEGTDLRAAGVRWPALYRLAGRVATRLLLAPHDVSVLLPSYRTLLIERYGADPDRVYYRPHGTFGDGSVSVPRPSDQPVVVAFGYWGTYKRLETLLEAMQAVAAEVPQTMLVVAGFDHPSASGYLASLAEQTRRSGQRVRFAGYVPESELAELFASARLLVMPYTTVAGASGVMYQGCEHGLPIVAADLPALREQARDTGIDVAFYDCGDASALARHLLRLLHSPELCRSLAEQNRLAAHRQPIAASVREYLELFAARLATGRGGARQVLREAR